MLPHVNNSKTNTIVLKSFSNIFHFDQLNLNIEGNDESTTPVVVSIANNVALPDDVALLPHVVGLLDTHD